MHGDKKEGGRGRKGGGEFRIGQHRCFDWGGEGVRERKGNKSDPMVSWEHTFVHELGLVGLPQGSPEELHSSQSVGMDRDMRVRAGTSEKKKEEKKTRALSKRSAFGTKRNAL